MNILYKIIEITLIFFCVLILSVALTVLFGGCVEKIIAF